MLDVESITVRETEGEFVVTLNHRPDFLAQFNQLDGCGDTLSEAFYDLADQLDDSGL